MSLLAGKLRVVQSSPNGLFAIQYLKDASDTGQISLVKSALGLPFMLKNQSLADLLCMELQGAIKSNMMIAKAITRAQQIEYNREERKVCIDSLSRFYRTDTLLYRDNHDLASVPEWDQCVDLFRSVCQLNPKLQFSMHFESDGTDKSNIIQVVHDYDYCKLAAVELATTHCKSFILGVLVVNNKLDPKQAAECALLEQARQSVKWGDLAEHQLERSRLVMHIYLSKLLCA